VTEESVYASSDTDHGDNILKTNELNNNKELPTSWPQTPRCDAADAAWQHRERNGTRALVCRQIQYAYVAVALSSLKKSPVIYSVDDYYWLRINANNPWLLYVYDCVYRTRIYARIDGIPVLHGRYIIGRRNEKNTNCVWIACWVFQVTRRRRRLYNNAQAFFSSNNYRCKMHLYFACCYVKTNQLLDHMLQHHASGRLN